MGISVKVSKRTIQFNEQEKELYIASANRGGLIPTKKIAQYIAQDTGARPAQVRLILTSLIDSMMGWLEEGHGVNLEGFGSFLPSVKSQSSKEKEEVGVKRVRVSFYPSRDLSQRMRGISYRIDDEVAVSAPEEEAGNDTNDGEENGGSGESNPL